MTLPSTIQELTRPAQARRTALLLTDEPIVDAAADETGLQSFVWRLVRPLLALPAESGIVVGLYGPWGHGKSSALNLLADLLQSHDEEGDGGAIVVRFNPWLYHDTESLLLSFFGTVTGSLGEADLLDAHEKTKLKTAVRALAAFTVPVMKILPMPGAAATVIEAGLGGLEKLLDGGEKDFESRKREVSEVLRRLASGRRAKRVVVLIDDLDRADPAEVLAMLKLVKLIAALPNVTYVLGMDDRRVRALLSKSNTPNYGADYLEKIVQVAIYLPPLESEALQSLVMRAITAELVNAGLSTHELERAEYEGGLSYRKTLGRRIATLRDRARFVNTLRFALAAGDSVLDVSAVDMVLISFLQTFFPDVYDAVRRNRAFLTVSDPYEAGFTDEAKRKAAEARAKRLQAIAGMPDGNQQTPEAGRSTDDATTAMNVLRFLFPRAELGAFQQGEDARRTRADNRIQSPDRFDRYFRLSPPTTEVPDAEVRNVIATMAGASGEDRDRREELIRGSVERFARHPDTQVRGSFYEKLRDHLSELPYEAVFPVGEAIIGLDDVIDAGVVAQLVDDLLVRLASPRVGEDRQLVTDGELAARLVVDEIGRMGNAEVAIDLAERYADRQSGVLPFRDEALRAFAVAGLRRAVDYFARRIDVFDVPTPGMMTGHLIWDWYYLSLRANESVEPVRTYIMSLLNRSPERLSDVLGLAAGWSDNQPGYRGTRPLDEILDSLSRISDIDEIVRRVKRHDAPAGRYGHLIVDLRRLLTQRDQPELVAQVDAEPDEAPR